MAIFDNGNGLFTINGNLHLVDMASGQVDNALGIIGPNQLLLFDVGEEMTDDKVACACYIQPTLVLYCDCLGGYMYFQTDATRGLLLSEMEGSKSSDPMGSIVRVVVQYVS